MFKKSLRKRLQEEEPGDAGVKKKGPERSAATRGSSEMEGELKTTVTEQEQTDMSEGTFNWKHTVCCLAATWSTKQHC